MKDNELRSYLERIAHAVECIADALSPKEAEISPEEVKFVEVATEEKKEPEIAPAEKVKELKEVTGDDIEKAEIAFNEFIDLQKEAFVKVGEKKSHEEEKPVEEVKVEEKPIVKKSPSKPRKELKRINPYRKLEEGPRKPVSGFRIKED